MRQGLIAQWHRGIVARGLVGACLLMIPVLVAATIGFGGVPGGLSSLATGPSESAASAGLQPAGQGDKGGNLERISAVLTSSRLAEESRHATGSGGDSSSGAPAVAPDTGTLSDQSTGPSGSNPTGGGTGGAATTPPPDNVSVPASTPDVVTQLMQSLGLAP
jgi:hypothetical protein